MDMHNFQNTSKRMRYPVAMCVRAGVTVFKATASCMRRLSGACFSRKPSIWLSLRMDEMSCQEVPIMVRSDEFSDSVRSKAQAKRPDWVD